MQFKPRKFKDWFQSLKISKPRMDLWRRM